MTTMTSNKNKSLDSILARNDYKRLTASLKERVEDIAKRIREKMEELDIPHDEDFYEGEICANGVTVRIDSVRTNGLGSYEFLAIRREGEYHGEYSWYSLEDINREYYYAGDFNARVRGANSKEALAFLNVARQLIEGLGAVERVNTSMVEKALNDTENIK